MIRPANITGGVFVGSRQNVDTRVVRMAPRFVDPQEIMVRPLPTGGKRHGRLPLMKPTAEAR